MLGPHITSRRILVVLGAGFSLVIGFLLVAAYVGVRSIRSIQENAANMVSRQMVSNRLIGELQRHQSSLAEVFSILARDPDSVDYDRIMAQLDEADRNIARIVQEGEQTPQYALWKHLQRTSLDFSAEARRLLSAEEPETFASIDLFRDHEAFVAVVARLLQNNYREVLAAQEEIGRRARPLLRESLLLAGACMALAVAFAVVTLRMSGRLIRDMEWQSGELSRVSWHMLENQESVARRFSHELHDELGQSLTAVKTNLAALSAGGGIGGARLQDCLRLVDESIGNVREMSHLLRPTILDDFGLEAGLRWLAEGFTCRTGIEVDLQSSGIGRLPDETETHLFRIAQEALTNVARHAQATHVAMRLERNGRRLVLSIRDNGRGFSPPAPGSRGGMGMIGMRARARSLGGDVSVNSQPGAGVEVAVSIPAERSA